MQKSYCYTPRVGVSVRVHMQNVRANVKVMEFQSLLIFSCILTLLIVQIKPFTTKAYDRRASGDCGTSGFSSVSLAVKVLTPFTFIYITQSIVYLAQS